MASARVEFDLDRVQRKADEWADSLIDLGGRNTLLSFKATKTSCLELGDAEPEELAKLLRSGTCRLSQLFPDRDRHQRAVTQARSLARRVAQVEEEQGVDPARLALGVLTTDRAAGARLGAGVVLRAPLLLRAVRLRSGSRTDAEFTVELGEETEPNVVLLHALQKLFGLEMDIAKIEAVLQAAIASAIDDPSAQAASCASVLGEVAAAHRLTVGCDPSAVALGLFNYQKLPMVNDLRAAGELLAGHEVIAMLANEAIESPGTPEGGSEDLSEEIHPRDEFVVMDADASQQHAIDAVMRGEHAIVLGPPGTGKSQTIANIIAGAAARGKRVLFVAEKRAAIEAVTQRLDGAGLDGLVFDLHRQTISRRQVAEQLSKTIDRAGRAAQPTVDEAHERLIASRDRVNAHVKAMHEKVVPWGMSPYEVLSEALAMPEHAETSLRFRGAVLYGLDAATFGQAQEQLIAFFHLGGARIRRGESPWSNAAVRSQADVRRLIGELDELTGQTLDRSRVELDALLQTARLVRPSDLAGWQDTLALLQGVSETVGEFGDSVFEVDLDRLVVATGDRYLRKTSSPRLGWFEQRRLAKQARSLSRSALRGPALHQALADGRRRLASWTAQSIDGGRPFEVGGVATALSHFGELRDRLAAVAAHAGFDQAELTARSVEDVDERVRQLSEDRNTLFSLVDVNPLTDALEALGLANLLDELCRLEIDPPELAGELFRWAWLQSVLDELMLEVPQFRQFVGAQHDGTVAEFGHLDRAHLEQNCRRVARRVAETLHAARLDHPEQYEAVAKEAKKKARHKSLRTLMSEAPELLLAAYPCWAMSPLIVSRMLPAERLFDLVVFDEASQIVPQDAVTSIMRGQQIILAGDGKQLPPTSFFQRYYQSNADEDSEDDLDVYESILDVLEPRLPSHLLTWHYRSRDERLIAFSNEYIYDGELVTFPGRQAEPPLTLEVVDGSAPPGTDGIASQEFERAVDLIVDHARARPYESLGVIAFSDKQADRIELALRQARTADPDLDEVLAAAPGGAPFFVKNLERVQGDERDAIILSIGHAKSPTGQVGMNFGPLNKPGGERRLNVAITRARRRMTVVSSFAPSEMSPDSKARGVDLLRRFLEFAGNEQRLDRIGRVTDRPINGFEADVHDALVKAGLPVHPQWGVSGYCIDFALAHADRPGQMVLAVETDGERYHRSPRARDRDRLRQSHLEALGWRFLRIWSTSWFKNREHELARVRAAWQSACEEENHGPSLASPNGPSVSQAEERAATVDRGPCPVSLRRRVQDQPTAELIELFRWLLSDGLLLDPETRVRQAQQLYGIAQLRSPIRKLLTDALTVVESNRGRGL